MVRKKQPWLIGAESGGGYDDENIRAGAGEGYDTLKRGDDR